MLCKEAPSQTKYEQVTISNKKSQKKKKNEKRGRQLSASGEHPHRQVRGLYSQHLMSAIIILAKMQNKLSNFHCFSFQFSNFQFCQFSTLTFNFCQFKTPL